LPPHLGLASVEALEARYTLSRNGDKVKLEGAISGKVHQTCIVSLEPSRSSSRCR
jgi:hypothetical protein